MAKSPQAHIASAIESLAKAQQAIQSQVSRHDKIIASQGRDIAALEAQVQHLRNSAIQADIAAGMSGREAAAKYGLSEGRVSQIKKS